MITFDPVEYAELKQEVAALRQEMKTISEEDKMLISLGRDDTRRPLITVHNEDASPAIQLLRYQHGGAVTVFNDDGTRQAAVMGSAEGGKLGVFGDLGI